jgi:hypothetical protein
MAEDKAPPTEQERVAVLRFFDGFAKGKADSFKGGLEREDARVLDAMVRGGGFEKACAAISRVDVSYASVGGKSYALAYYRAGGEIQAQLWQYKVDGEGRTVKSRTFTSVFQPVDVVNRISGSKLVAEWLKLVDAERKVATVPDEVTKPVARVQEQEASESSGGGGGGGGESAPGRNREPPGSIPGRRGPQPGR